ncbi:hypothetical protein, partial [Delftia tsuruhatensis]|uniref:hypothetical protein n=1 Tax=Delftia tsuruhatensis TaxID=180282 RepID=UPI0039F0B1B1
RALFVLMGVPSRVVGLRVGELRGIMPHCPTSNSPPGLTYGPRASGVTCGFHHLFGAWRPTRKARSISVSRGVLYRLQMMTS